MGEACPGHEVTAASGSLPPGLLFREDVISEAEEQAVIALIEELGLRKSRYDPGNPRFSRAFGWDYDFVADSFVACDPVPEGFLTLCRIAADAASVAPDAIAEVLLNRYEPGAIIQPHLDKPCWEEIIGLSLGSDVVMDFSTPSDDGGHRLPVSLPRRSLYVMTGEARWRYRHELPPMPSTRWSITFRVMSESGRNMLQEAFAQQVG